MFTFRDSCCLAVLTLALAIVTQVLITKGTKDPQAQWGEPVPLESMHVYLNTWFFDYFAPLQIRQISRCLTARQQCQDFLS